MNFGWYQKNWVFGRVKFCNFWVIFVKCSKNFVNFGKLYRKFLETLLYNYFDEIKKKIWLAYKKIYKIFWVNLGRY